MRELNPTLRELAKRCQTILDSVRSTSTACNEASTRTQIEYIKQAKQLLARAKQLEGGLYRAVQATTSISTFRKRLAALVYFLNDEHAQLIRELSQPVIPAPEVLHLRLAQHQKHLQALQRLRQEGMTAERTQRRSKRQSLAGLPRNWRIDLCKRAAHGRYIFPLVVLALTGCRPSELVAGIQIWRDGDPATGKDLIHFRIRGAKVKASQGQPCRTISYEANDSHPLMVVVNELLHDQENSQVFAQVNSAVNLTVEIRRLACSLWPKHKHTVTAYCFRHQFAADLKASDDEEATSRGLGHLSAKTRRLYGTAAQASKGYRNRPLRVEADRPVKPHLSGRLNRQADSPTP